MTTRTGRSHTQEANHLGAKLLFFNLLGGGAGGVMEADAKEGSRREGEEYEDETRDDSESEVEEVQGRYPFDELVPLEVTLTIVSKLKQAGDLVRCGMVCKSWASVFLSDIVWRPLFRSSFAPHKYRFAMGLPWRQSYLRAADMARKMTTTTQLLDWGLKNGLAMLVKKLIDDNKVSLDLLGGSAPWKEPLYPMSLAIRSRSLETVRVLLEAGVSVRGYSRAPKRPLRHTSGARVAGIPMFTWAVECSSLEIVEELLPDIDFSAEVKLHTLPQICPLHAAGTP